MYIHIITIIRNNEFMFVCVGVVCVRQRDRETCTCLMVAAKLLTCWIIAVYWTENVEKRKKFENVMFFLYSYHVTPVTWKWLFLILLNDYIFKGGNPLAPHIFLFILFTFLLWFWFLYIPLEFSLFTFADVCCAKK